MVTETLIYECLVCGDRKLVDYSPGPGTVRPTLWCSHHNTDDQETFTIMEVVDE